VTANPASGKLAAWRRRVEGRFGGAVVSADAALMRTPHLRYASVFVLANAGHDTRALQAYLGHRNIQHTVRHTELVPNRFKDFWR
jgi:site-specific recombinase XerD